MSPKSRPKRRWYEDGLQFSCTQCGKCCSVEGYVWVDRSAMEAIARHLGQALNVFTRRYVRKVGRRYSLIEKPGGHECVFFDQGCTIYDVRPEQCRTFPFWKEHLVSLESWDEPLEECPGTGAGRLFSRGEIDELRRGRGET